MSQANFDRRKIGDNVFSNTGSNKNSFGSVDSTHSSDAHNYENGDERNRFAMRGLDGLASPGLKDIDSRLAQEIDDYDSLNRESIFTRLMPRENYEDKPTCKVCGKAFSKLKLIAKKHCKFCGGCICEDHGKKKRPNPENPSEYVRVCDICDEKFINRAILKEFNDKLKKKEGEIQELEKKIREQQLKIGNEQKEYDELCIKKSRNDKNYSDQMKFLSDDIARTKEEIKRSEKENNELNKEYSKTQTKILELDNEIQNAEQEYEKLIVDAAKLTNQIEALNQDISQMNREIRNIEEYVTQNRSYVGTMHNESRIGKPGEDTPGKQSDPSTSTKLNSYKKGAMKGAKKSKTEGESKSGNCDINCNLF